MKLKIDRAGRIVVPKVVRERFGMKPGTPVEAVEQQDGLLLRGPLQRPSMIKINGCWVHQGIPEANANWDRVIDEVREERDRSNWDPKG